MKFSLLLIMMAFASDNQENKVESAKSEDRFTEKNTDDLTLVKIEEEEYTKVKRQTSTYIGVSYNEPKARWGAYRWSKIGKKLVVNGAYKDEETAAHASDTLARKLMEHGEQNLKLNFPDDLTEVFPEKKNTSKHIGVCYNESYKTWAARRWSNSENKKVHNGTYDDEETAAHASDTLARKLMANGEHNLKLNFPDDHAEVHRQEKTASSKYIGVSYKKVRKKWYAYRWSRRDNKTVHNGSYKDEEAAAYASDTLARDLMASGEKNHKLNFPDDKSEEMKINNVFKKKSFSEYQKNKRKRSELDNEDHSQNKY